MLTEQVDVSITDTFARQRAYAHFNDLRLADVARDIVGGRLRLAPDHRGGAGGGRYELTNAFAHLLSPPVLASRGYPKNNAVGLVKPAGTGAGWRRAALPLTCRALPGSPSPA
jgi:hypothetical protein